MFERIQRSWELVREAWGVLKQDRELLLFPVMSGIASFLVLASFAVPVILLLPWGEITSSSGGGRVQVETGPLHYAVMFLYYLVSYFVIVFFNVGLVACARIRFSGGDPTVGDGLSFASRNVGRIFQWALLSATVGTILRAIEERVGWLGQIIIGLIGLVWSLATMFVVPVLVYEGVGPVDAVKRSAAAFKRTWGEAVVGNFGIGTAFGLLWLAGFLALIAAIAGGIALAGSSGALALTVIIGAVVLCVLYWVALAIVQSALQGIFLTACYEYATSGNVPPAFSRDLVVHAWRPKG
jgi:hypothetical protein